MTKNKQVLIRVTEEEQKMINEICKIENKSISQVIRELINYRHSYLKKNKKTKVETPIIKDSYNEEIDEETLNEFRRLFS